MVAFVVVVVVNWSWLLGLVVVERWWLLLLSEVMGFAAERVVVVVVFGWFRCALVVVGGMLEVVVAMGWVVRGRWLRFHGSVRLVVGAEAVLYSAPPIPAGILRNPQEWHRNPQESSGICRNGTGIELKCSGMGQE